MKLDVSFGALDAIRRRMGAPLREWRANIDAPPLATIRHEPREWDIEDLSELEVGPGETITIEGRRVFLYIREFRVNADSFEEACDSPTKLRRFHVVWCQTLKEMKSHGRFERYVASDRVNEPFGVAMQLKTNEWACGDAELHVCRFCLSHTNWDSYQVASRKRRSEIVERFSRARFLETDVSRFAELPSRTDESEPDLGYAKDWADRSRAYRKSVGFRCEDCGVDCITRPSLLDTHHQNGVTSDNRVNNLRALCKLCHENRHPNWYRVSSADRRMIEELRRAQRL